MPRTYNQIFLDARKRLKEYGVEAYSLEARVILAHAAEKSMDVLMRDMHLYSATGVEERVEELMNRRLRGEPVAYITGEWEFYGIPLEITSGVLIPRADTEVLVDTVVNALRGRKMDARILDLCSGSGCIGCAIAKTLPATRVVLVDNSRKALELSKRNALKNDLLPRVSFMEADALAQPPMMLGSFDMLVCNPPYIPSADIIGLEVSVRDYEPRAALDGGDDGLDFYRSILSRWRNVVRVGGAMLFEVGIGQANDVAELMRAAGLADIGLVKDTHGIDRVVYGKI